MLRATDVFGLVLHVRLVHSNSSICHFISIIRLRGHIGGGLVVFSMGVEYFGMFRGVRGHFEVRGGKTRGKLLYFCAVEECTVLGYFFRFVFSPFEFCSFQRKANC